MTKLDGSAFHQLRGKKNDLLTPNLFIDVDDNNRTLYEYYNANLDYILSNYKNESNVDLVEVESRSEFNAGEFNGYRAVLISNHKRGVKVRSILYFFNGKGDAKISITATMLQSEKDELDKIFDDAIMSLRFEK